MALQAVNVGRPVALETGALADSFRSLAGDLGGIVKAAASVVIECVRSARVPAGVRGIMSSIATIPTSPAGRIKSTVDERTSRYLELKGRVHQELLNRLNLDRLTQVSRADAEPEIRSVVGMILDRESATMPLSLFERETVSSDVLDELFGLGPLELLLKDPAISDILVNRADQVYIEREGRIEETDIVFRDDKHLMQIIERIVSAVGRRIDESSPMVDARLQDGSRVNVIIPPLALDGPVMSIRRFRTDRLGANDLVRTRVVDRANAGVSEGCHRGAV